MDWEEEIWDKIWICGIFWGFWMGGFGGERGFVGFGGILLVEGKIGDLVGNLFSGDGGILKNLLVRWGVGWIEVDLVWLGRILVLLCLILLY